MCYWQFQTLNSEQPKIIAQLNPTMGVNKETGKIAFFQFHVFFSKYKQKRWLNTSVLFSQRFHRFNLSDLWSLTCQKWKKFFFVQTRRQITGVCAYWIYKWAELNDFFRSIFFWIHERMIWWRLLSGNAVHVSKISIIFVIRLLNNEIFWFRMPIVACNSKIWSGWEVF